MGSTKKTYHKEWRFASNYFIFSEILFVFKILVLRVDLMYQPPKMSIFMLFQSVGVLFEGAFSLWVSLTKIKHAVNMD